MTRQVVWQYSEIDAKKAATTSPPPAAPVFHPPEAPLLEREGAHRIVLEVVAAERGDDEVGGALGLPL